MCLQNILCKKIIHHFKTKKNFRLQLQILSSKLSKSDVFYVDNMIIYYSSLFRLKMNVEKDAVYYCKKTEATLGFLNQRIKTFDCVTSKKLIDIVETKHLYIKKIKLIEKVA